MSDIIEINLDKHGIGFIPTEIALHPDDGIGRLAFTLGPRYIPRMGTEGCCPPNVRYVDVVFDTAVTPGLAQVRRSNGSYVTLTLARW